MTSPKQGYGHNEAFTRGFDAGNYGNAYESQDWESWYADRCADDTFTDDRREGMLLGFFSSYEIHEIPSDVADDVASLRAKWGDAS